MPHLPFGYPFEIKTRMSPSSVKGRIRARKKGWFDPNTGARGWIVGSLMCLWLSPFNRYGPMLLGWISADGASTRILGRAGSDLNGMLMLAVCFPFIVLMAFIAFREESFGGILLGVGLISLFPLTLWINHKARREADPLVRFLEDAVSASGKSLRQRSTRSMTITGPLILSIGGEKWNGNLTPAAIYDALLDLGDSDFLIVESADETYIQMMATDGGFIIEKRDGGGERHFKASRQAPSSRKAARKADVWPFEETMAVLAAYVSNEPTPHFVRWEPLR
ncbi:MAG: hypothetical protein ACK4FB_09455 [Brevundimonas sp.]|uniref:hypothetical protein n=1 Tax=Brevundimonas sp. TaxID=1871086 RepID=UPI003918FD2B